MSDIRTPPPPATPRINGPDLYGQRPHSPFLYSIPATGREPIVFSAVRLPAGLKLDSQSGRITGLVATVGDYPIQITATNAVGSHTRTLTIRIGESICLTPPLGWNSWNCFAAQVDQAKVLAQARALVSSGISKHGWTYVNIDDSWQGRRGGPDLALQPNDKFPDIARLCDQIHALGLKAGIYSTPWHTSYAGFTGGSSISSDGAWTPPPPGKQDYKGGFPYAIAEHHFAHADAHQWAKWGFDYLKYDWHPIDVPAAREMSQALRACGRDIVYSLSNTAALDSAGDFARLANCWRTTGDILDTWESMSHIGFSQEPWTPFGGIGHWNDPDMLVVGSVGWGNVRPTRLTHDEQYTHITLWCLLASPLLLGCDLTQLDDFTLGLLTNDEVLAVNQDPLGRQARPIARDGSSEVWAKPLADASWAVGLFNRGETLAEVTVSLSALNFRGKQSIRDLWRQKGLPPSTDHFSIHVAPHSAELVKVTGI